MLGSELDKAHWTSKSSGIESGFSIDIRSSSCIADGESSWRAMLHTLLSVCSYNGVVHVVGFSQMRYASSVSSLRTSSSGLVPEINM